MHFPLRECAVLKFVHMMIKRGLTGLSILLFALSGGTMLAQDVADINLDVRHSLNGISELDRSKFIMIHAGSKDEWPTTAVERQFLEDYDVYLGRNNGSMPWYYSICKQDPAKPGWPSIPHLQQKGAELINDYKNNWNIKQYEHRRYRYMMGGQEGMYPNQTRLIGPTGAKWYMAKEGYAPLAEFFANYLKYSFGTGGSTGHPLPTFVEPMNEPFVKSGELGTTNANLSEMHKVVARRIKELNPGVKVGGYSAAHPAFEAGNFRHWENTWETFIDIAGEDMDFWSVHLYDNTKDHEENSTYRAGANVEAILDMIEHYSYLKFNVRKPFCISEYGSLLQIQDKPYSRARDWHNIRSFSTIMMQLMERQDVIEMALPFMLVKATWWKNDDVPEARYPYRLFRQKWEVEGETGNEWVYTEVVKFYQLWANVRGTRVDTRPGNLDVQVDTYVDSNKAYVIVNNMHQEARTVDLYIDGTGDAELESVFIKHMHAGQTGIPTLDSSVVYEPVERVDLGREATMILEYTFDRSLEMTDSSCERKYYASAYFKEIVGGQQLDFGIDSVVLGDKGEAVLRLGVGRDHGKSLYPEVRINDTLLSLPSSFRGDDLLRRDRFFGVLEIPVPYSALKDSNAISVTFADGGGHVSSVSMQVFNFSREISRTGEEILDVIISRDSRTMKPGKHLQLEAEVLPVNFENRNISWHSTDTNVATISETGLINSISEGSASIVVTTEADGLTDTCFVEVNEDAPPILAESIGVVPGSLSIIMGNTSSLSAELGPLDIDIWTVEWTSADTAIAEVSTSGEVTAKSIGQTYISARTTDGSNIRDSIILYVLPMPNSVDCSLFPVYVKSDSVLSFDVKYTLGDTMDIAVEVFWLGNPVDWVADDQVAAYPGAGTVTVEVFVTDTVSGLGAVPDAGSYIAQAWIREPGGDESTNSKKCFSSVVLTPKTGIEESAADRRSIRVYPNPAGNSFELRGNLSGQISVIVYDIQGRPCLDFSGNEQQQYNISKLAAGTYLVRVLSGDYSKVSILVKE